MSINNRAYVSYNEKCLHVWKPDTEEQIFYVNFFDETKSHHISCIVYSKKYHVTFNIFIHIDTLSSTWQSQRTSNSTFLMSTCTI